MPQFSTHESVSLEKEVELKQELIQTNSTEIHLVYDLEKCAKWIKENDFKKVCLQFPDHLLPDSTDVALHLQNVLGQTVYVLGDTAYESCCIDYVAAAHINADAIIHFGPTCFSKTTESVPYLNIYEKFPINADDLKSAFTVKFIHENDNLLMLLDDVYINAYDDLCILFKDQQRVQIQKIDDDGLDFYNKSVIFIGNNQRKLMNIDLTFRPKNLYYFDPQKSQPDITLYQTDSKILKRRYFLMEKIRDANTIGIVVGTLGVKNYLRVIERVKKLVEKCGKKYYLISVGKPTVAKLANLGEIEIYVMITCSMNEIFESRDFYKPIVTPFDIEMALNTNTNDLQFTYDFSRYLHNLEDIESIKLNQHETDVSLLSNRIRSNIGDSVKINQEVDKGQVALRSEGTVAVNANYGAGFLSERTWKGLEQNLGQNEVKLAEEGRKGIAQCYDNEK